ncbi:TetR/AcrR family transcriptional regulator [Pseudomonas benzenivorans]|uniref:TetR/AcrR family transcriptional regulator n=1 Tax=Pseudomonas benzenivorans TaxID=556533 RepID=A0ABY5H718_9PSED|nr:TetR/AcrR family transcriptional regulator [Pseudomonas benzenivorans]UTW07219.1 TetR/AcrR family transcriptional regulator [Pseudomonas benzenivorans]
MPRTSRYDRQTALDKAVLLFWERGYFATSMKQIEEALDMRPGSLYATFGSKSGLFGEALDEYSRQMGEELAGHLARQSSRIAGLKSYLRAVTQSCLEPGRVPARACMLVKTLLEVNNQEPALQQQVNLILRDVEAQLAEVVQQAQEAGELRPEVDCQRLARLLQAQLIGLRSFAQRDVPACHLEALTDDMLAMLEPYRALPA